MEGRIAKIVTILERYACRCRFSRINEHLSKNCTDEISTTGKSPKDSRSKTNSSPHDVDYMEIHFLVNQNIFRSRGDKIQGERAFLSAAISHIRAGIYVCLVTFSFVIQCLKIPSYLAQILPSTP
jgi:hypothetical protein